MNTEAAQHVSDNGTIMVQLTRALYGRVQSSRLWYGKLRDVLVTIGFEINPYDLCKFNKTFNGVQLSLLFHGMIYLSLQLVMK